MDCMYVVYALDDGFLNPFVHLIFILIEPIIAKDVLCLTKAECHPKMRQDIAAVNKEPVGTT